MTKKRRWSGFKANSEAGHEGLTRTSPKEWGEAGAQPQAAEHRPKQIQTRRVESPVNLW